MFFLQDMVLDSNALTPTAVNTTINSIQISNGIFNHLNLLSVIQAFNTTIPTQWTNDTLLNATFNNNINGGSIGEFIGSIARLDIQRQEVGTNEWVTLQSIYKNQVTNTINTNFDFVDTTAKNDTLYTYQVIPVDENGNIGVALQQDILSRFNDAYIADGVNIYKITNEYQLSKTTNQVSAVYTPYGSQFPFVAFNASTKYDSGSVTAVLLSETSNSPVRSSLDRKAQTELVQEFNNWLTNGKAKILKDFNGLLKVIVVTDAVPNNYYKSLGNGLASTTFNFIEVGSFTQQYIDKLGISNSFQINYNN